MTVGELYYSPVLHHVVEYRGFDASGVHLLHQAGRKSVEEIIDFDECILREYRLWYASYGVCHA